MARGLFHVFTGDGKGKTTAAVGLSIRAKSQGLRVLFAQFMKGSTGGEIELMAQLSIKIVKFERVISPYFHSEADLGQIRSEILAAMKVLLPMLAEFDLAVLDEFNCLLSEKLLTDNEALDFLRQKPERLEIVLTGRGASQAVIDHADHVVDFHEVKRSANARSEARKGIEY